MHEYDPMNLFNLKAMLESSHRHILQWQIHSFKYTIHCRTHWQHDRIITLLLFVVYELL